MNSILTAYNNSCAETRSDEARDIYIHALIEEAVDEGKKQTIHHEMGDLRKIIHSQGTASRYTLCAKMSALHGEAHSRCRTGLE